jgi:hypothetical protein
LVDEEGWITLEDGVQIAFADGAAHVYRSGDYWLIPARSATGGLLWPRYAGDQGVDADPAVAPHGVDYHHAPLAVVTVDGGGKVTAPLLHVRRHFKPLAKF